MTTERKIRFIKTHGEAAWEEFRKRANEKAKEYYKKKKTHYALLQKEYVKTQRGRAKSLLGNYKRIDKEKGLECTITQDWIIGNIFNSSCVYCGEKNWEKLGCDRIDNSKGHTPENIVCSCMYCNAQRRDDYSVVEFIKQKGRHP